jgi:hypothetical protein
MKTLEKFSVNKINKSVINKIIGGAATATYNSKGLKTDCVDYSSSNDSWVDLKTGTTEKVDLSTNTCNC